MTLGASQQSILHDSEHSCLTGNNYHIPSSTEFSSSPENACWRPLHHSLDLCSRFAGKGGEATVSHYCAVPAALPLGINIPLAS